ncbi:unnamed protein product [Rhizopus microsporus]
MLSITPPFTSDSPSPSRANIPKSNIPQVHKKQTYNPFLRNQNGFDHNKMSLANTTLVAAQAAGMSNFVRGFKPKMGAGRHNGAIYATSTAVQQDIYRLERDLEKLLSHINTRSQDASFIDNNAAVKKELNNFSVKAGKKTKFLRYSTTLSDELLKQSEQASNVTRISANITSIMDIMKKHKSATRLPFSSDILAVLFVPFDRKPQKIEDCKQALDTFDYIRNRFKLLDSSEHFEQVLFCCSILSSSDTILKERVIGILNNLVEPCIEFPNYLPSSPAAFHSLVYAFAYIINRHTPKLDAQEATNNSSFVRSSVLDLLDKLSEGKLVSVVDDHWTSHYQVIGAAPGSLARICVLESLCKCLMANVCRQTNSIQEPDQVYDDHSISSLLELVQRYWIEPDTSILPAYWKILFLLTELASDVSLSMEQANISTVSQLLMFILENLAPSKLRSHIGDQPTGSKQKSVIFNLVTMLLCFLSIDCDTISPKPVAPLTSPSVSPNISPQPSINDMSPLINSPVITEEPEAPSIKNESIVQLLDTAKAYLVELWNLGYKGYILKCTEALIQDIDADKLANVYNILLFHLDSAIGQEIAKSTVQTLFKRIVDTTPPPTPLFCNMLHEIAKTFKPIFYKPVVSCVASDDNEKVASLLKLITHLRHYLTGVQFWMQDAEMINVLLLSDVGTSKTQREANSSQTNDGISTSQAIWGNTTLGQCIIATELVWVLKELREKQKDPLRNMEEDEIAKKFLIDLERRLALFLTAKEKKVIVPLPLRVILCNIFLNIRFFCNTTHRPGWLNCVISWATQPLTKDIFTQDSPASPLSTLLSEFDSSTGHMPLLDASQISKISVMFLRMQNAFLDVMEQFRNCALQDTMRRRTQQQQEATPGLINPEISQVPRHQRYQQVQSIYSMNSSAAAFLHLDPPEFVQDGNNQEEGETTNSLGFKLSKYRFDHISELNQDAFGSVLSLLAAVYATISSQEYERFVKILWEVHMNDKRPASYVPAVFLLMQCGEKIPKVTVDVIVKGLHSDDPAIKLLEIQKLSSLMGFRFNVLNQEFIQVSSHNKPFRGDGGTFSTPFVPTDLGSNEFTLDEPRWMSKLRNTSNLPIELKRQIQELGWNEDDNGEEYEALKKVLTPLCLLPSLFLEEDDERTNEEDELGIAVIRERGKIVNISKAIARKKRMASVYSFAAIFLKIVNLLADNSASVSSALRELVEQCLRDDPAYFLKAFLNSLGKNKADMPTDIIAQIHHIISLQRKLPPGLTNILFNYLAGMLKWIVRENKKNGLVLMTLIHPILAELTLSTNDLAIRDLRKNKIEHLLVSTGKFWFTHEQPMDIFPRYLSSSHHSFTVLKIPQQIFSVASLRISHIQFLTNYLLRFPREVYAVKKTLQDYEPMPIPGSKREPKYFLEKTYYPDISYSKKYRLHHTRKETQEDQIDKEMLASMRARTWLRFIDVLLNGLNKNYNDRDELERILQGVNSIITEFNHDFGIISQALVLYTRVVTRFKRLFKSNRGYVIFLPALFKVFCESESCVQVTSAIALAWCRFYAVHQEAFVFQMLGSLVPSILAAYEKSNELGSWMTENLFTLIQVMDRPPQLGSFPDTLGLQLQLELDDRERDIQDRIDSISNPTSLPLPVAIFKPLARSATAPMGQIETTSYSSRSFKLEDFIKLFLTVIAYDPSSLRAEQFVKLLTHLIPSFNKLSRLKKILQEGVSALVDVFLKFSKTAKPVIVTNAKTASGEYQGVSSNDRRQGLGNLVRTGAKTDSAQNAYGKQWQQNDRFTIKQEFITLVHMYMKHGGRLSETSHEKMAQIIRTVLRDYRSIKGLTIKTDWIRDYLVDSLHSMVDTRNYTKSLKKVLNEIYVQYRTQWKTVDASDLYEGLAIMLEQGQGKAIMMHDMAGVIKDRFIPFGLTVATLTSWDNESDHAKFCNSLVRLIIAILENSTQDVFAEIERQTPSVELIGRIIIPLCFQYNLQWEYSSVGTSSAFKPNPANNWTRLLNFLSNLCSHASLLKGKSPGFSLSQLATMGQSNTEDGVDAADIPEAKDGKQTPQSLAVLFSLCLVAIKIVLVRGRATFNDLKGSWSQIAFFIRNTLVFGQTLKLLRSKSSRSDQHNASTPTDAHSPFMPSPSVLSPLGLSTPGLSPYTISNPLPSSDLRANFSFNATVGVGTIYDFTTWKFLEFIVSFRSPLFILLKDFIYQKLNQMGNTSNNYQPSLYSPRASFNFPHDSTRWKSWGAELSSVNSNTGGNQSNSNASPQNIAIPKLNIEEVENTSVDMNVEGSPTFGLGLHLANKPSNTSPSMSVHIPPVPSSPALSAHSPTGFSETEGNIPHSPKQTSGPKQQEPSSNLPKENVLHMLHAETITSIVNTQISVGVKPSLPWIATDSQRRVKPWSNKDVIAKMANEWQLLLQLCAESDIFTLKGANISSSNIPASPLV